MRAFVDKNTCIACGMCASECPEVFEMEEASQTEESGKAALKLENVPDEVEHKCYESANNCPVGAITIK